MNQLAGQPEISIVMPCLNEIKTLPACIKKAQETIHNLNLAGEVIIADNGSTDGSQNLAESLGARVVNVPVRGYGAALIWAFEPPKGIILSWAIPMIPMIFEKLKLWLKNWSWVTNFVWELV